MTTIFVQRGDVAKQLLFTARDSSGFLAGQTVVCSVYDLEQGTWLDWSDDTWSATPVTQTQGMTQWATGRFRVPTNFANANAASTAFVAQFEIATGSGAGLTDTNEVLVVNQLYDLAAAAVLTSISGTTFDTLTDSLEAIRNRGDANWATGLPLDTPTVIAALNAAVKTIIDTLSKPGVSC